MKKLLLTLVISFCLFLVIGLILKQTVLKPVPAGLKIRSFPPSSVFLADKKIGQTPFEAQDLSAGEVALKLVPQDSSTAVPLETKIRLVSGVQTVINYDLGGTEAVSAGEVVVMEKIADKSTASLLVTSSPDSSLVKINGEAKGFTPLSLEKQKEGEQELTISAAGFTERNIKVNLMPGFRLQISVKLAENNLPVATGTPSPKASSTPTLSPVQLKKPYVTIKTTPTGWLRVRSEPSTSATELARVNPGESYLLLDQQTGWLKIRYQTGKEGWVSSQYVSKFE